MQRAGVAESVDEIERPVAEGVGNGDGHGVKLVIVAPLMGFLLADAKGFGKRGNSVDGYFH